MFKFKTFAKAELVEDNDGLLKKALAGHVEVPDEAPFDLLFFKAIYLTSGSNLNYAYFDKGELSKSLNTVANKAMDIEHEEYGIVGHIYSASFFGAENKELIENASIEDHEGKVDVVITGVVYKDRFPELASEISKGEWFVSMETYYKSFDVKIGDLCLDQKTASALGVMELIGKEVILQKSGSSVTEGVAYKLLRDLHFSGGGFVKDPANPTSIILDTSDTNIIDLAVASKKDKETNEDKVVIDLNELKEVAEKVVSDMLLATSECTNCTELIKEVAALIFDVSVLLDKELSAKWTTKFINSLPDSAFIVVEPSYKSGKDEDKRARHLPYKNKEGKIDLPHLRNALARCNQIKAVTDSTSTEDLRKKACKKAQSLAKKHLKSEKK